MTMQLAVCFSSSTVLRGGGGTSSERARCRELGDFGGRPHVRGDTQRENRSTRETSREFAPFGRLRLSFRLGERWMKTEHHGKGALTRADLRAAVYACCSVLERRAADEIVDVVLEEITEALVSGEPVKLHGFGAFRVRSKSPRIGRNPKTRAPALIIARRVLTFRPARALVARMNQSPEADL
jgi:integration host factor subunit alpha